MGMLLNRHRNRHEAAQEADVPDGEPTEKWTNDQITEYAKAHDVDLTGATKKAEYLAAIKAKAEQDEREAQWPVFSLTVPNPDNADEPLHTGDVKAEDVESAVAAFRAERELASDVEVEVVEPQ